MKVHRCPKINNYSHKQHLKEDQIKIINYCLKVNNNSAISEVNIIEKILYISFLHIHYY